MVDNASKYSSNLLVGKTKTVSCRSNFLQYVSRNGNRSDPGEKGLQVWYIRNWSKYKAHCTILFQQGVNNKQVNQLRFAQPFVTLNKNGRGQSI